MLMRLLAGFVLAFTFVLASRAQERSAENNATANAPPAAAQPAEQPAGVPKLIKQPPQLNLRKEPFSFVRVEYTDNTRRVAPGEALPRRASSFGIWRMDYPTSDLNFSKRLAAVTGLKTELDAKSFALTDPELKQFPFLYLVEGGHLRLDREEADALRAYLDGGGFLLVDDFWGEAEWASVAAQFKQVFPAAEPKELELDHPIFRSFYDLKEKPQVLHIQEALQLRGRGNVNGPPPGIDRARYLGITDDKGRLMVVFCHNTDLGDGWERDGDDAFYSREYSQKRAFPMGINIVVYALTQNGGK